VKELVTVTSFSYFFKLRALLLRIEFASVNDGLWKSPLVL
jgi:hypothetical protein